MDDPTIVAVLGLLYSPCDTPEDFATAKQLEKNVKDSLMTLEKAMEALADFADRNKQ